MCVNIFGSKNLLKQAPTETNNTAGTPRFKTIFLSNPFLKMAIT